MSKLLHKVIFWLSVISGAVFGVVTTIIVSYIDGALTDLGVLAGVLFAILLYIFFRLYLFIPARIREKKYKALEAKLPFPVLYKTDARLFLEVSVRLCFGSDRFSILDVNRKPPSIKTILYSDITSWGADYPKGIIIRTCDDQIFELQVARDELLSALKKTIGLEIKE
jgi:hypothetical protein